MTKKFWEVRGWQQDDVDYLTENGINNSVHSDIITVDIITVDSYPRRFNVTGKSTLRVVTNSDREEVLIVLKFGQRLVSIGASITLSCYCSSEKP